MTPEERAAKIVHEGTSIELVAWEVSVDCDQLCAEIADAIRAAVAEERERCAKIAEEYIDSYDANQAARLIADEIRETGINAEQEAA